MYSIYLITNKVNNKKYIGYSKNPKARFIQHTRLANRKTKLKYKLHKAIKKYGIENFFQEVIYQSEDMNYVKNIMESYFIKKYDSYKNGYNMSLGGDGVGIMSEETKQKLSKLASKRLGKLNPNYGNKWSKKQKQEMSKKITGIKHHDMQGEKSPNVKFRKPYKITFDDGHSETIVGLKKFCRDNGHTQNKLWALRVGKILKYKNIIKIEKL